MPIFQALMLICAFVGVVRGGAFNVLPGLSAKNFLMYSCVGMLLLRAILSRRVMVLKPGVIAAFAIMIVYEIVSAMAVSTSGLYAHYQLKESLMRIKTEELDGMFFFLVFSTGVADRAEAKKLLELFLLLMGLANVITIWNAAGLPRIGMEVYNPEVAGGLRRVNGFFGHANETGSLICATLPLYLATIAESRGMRRVGWIGLILFSVMVLVATGSRGALVGLFIGGVWAAYRFRRYVSVGPFLRWGGLAVLLGALVVPFMGMGYLEKFVDRFTSTSIVSANDVTSGRSDMWMSALRVMASKPWYLLSGVGWNTWTFQSIDGSVAHNNYLTVYFDIGLIGLGCFLYVIGSIYGASRRAVLLAPTDEERRLPLAFAFSILIFSVCCFFSTMYIPWLYIWPLYGLSARLAFETSRAASKPQPEKSRRRAANQGAVPRKDVYSLPKRPRVTKSSDAALPAGRR